MAEEFIYFDTFEEILSLGVDMIFINQTIHRNEINANAFYINTTAYLPNGKRVKHYWLEGWATGDTEWQTLYQRCESIITKMKAVSKRKGIQVYAGIITDIPLTGKKFQPKTTT